MMTLFSCLSPARLAALPLLLSAALPLAASAAAPAWWQARSVMDVSQTSNDFAAVNTGQLKHMAQQAMLELDLRLPNGAGTAIHDMVTAWSTASPERNDFAAVNIGQLKAVAKPFYDRLNGAGLALAYPWSPIALDRNDFAAVNIGQLKHVFSFAVPDVTTVDSDTDGLPDWWETHFFASLSAEAASADTDGDGMTNLQEWQYKTSPNATDTDGDTWEDGVEVAAGAGVLNNATIPTSINPTFLDEYVTIKQASAYRQQTYSMSKEEEFSPQNLFYAWSNTEIFNISDESVISHQAGAPGTSWDEMTRTLYTVGNSGPGWPPPDTLLSGAGFKALIQPQHWQTVSYDLSGKLLLNGPVFVNDVSAPYPPQPSDWDHLGNVTAVETSGSRFTAQVCSAVALGSPLRLPVSVTREYLVGVYDVTNGLPGTLKEIRRVEFTVPANQTISNSEAFHVNNRTLSENQVVYCELRMLSPVDLPVQVNSMDRYVAGSVPLATISALGGDARFGLLLRNPSTGEEYRFNQLSDAHVYDDPLMPSPDDEDKFLSNSEISAWKDGSNNSVKELTQEVVFYKQNGLLHFRGLFDNEGEIEVSLLQDGNKVRTVVHTLTPDPDIGPLLETIDSILAGTWDDPGGIVVAAMQQGISGNDLEALQSAAGQIAASSFVAQSNSGGFTGFLRRNLTIKVNIPTWKAVKDRFVNGVREAGQTAARAIKVVAFTGKGFCEGAWMGVKDDAASLVELGQMILNPAETAKTFYEGFKVLIELDMEGWKNVGRTLVKSFLEKGDEGVGEWAEPNDLDVGAYLVGFTAGFITEQIVVTYVTAGILKAGNIGAKIGKFISNAAKGISTALEGAAQAVRTLMMKSKNSLFRRFSQDVLNAEDVKTLKRMLQELELACPL